MPQIEKLCNVQRMDVGLFFLNNLGRENPRYADYASIVNMVGLVPFGSPQGMAGVMG